MIETNSIPGADLIVLFPRPASPPIDTGAIPPIDAVRRISTDVAVDPDPGLDPTLDIAGLAHAPELAGLAREENAIGADPGDFGADLIPAAVSRGARPGVPGIATSLGAHPILVGAKTPEVHPAADDLPYFPQSFRYPVNVLSAPITI